MRTCAGCYTRRRITTERAEVARPVHQRLVAMKLRHLFTANAVVNLVFGAALVFTPAWLLSLGAVTLTPTGLAVSRLFGALHWGVAVGLLDAHLRSVDERAGAPVVAKVLLMFNAVGCAVFLQSTLQGAVNAFGWTVVATYGLLSAGYRAVTLPSRR